MSLNHEACVQDVAFSTAESSHVGKLCLQLNCNCDCIHILRSMVAVMTARAGFDELRSNRVAIAVDELFANIARHAYRGRPGRVEIETEIVEKAGQRRLQFDFRDYASFGWTGDVRKFAEQKQDCEHLKPGGLGLKLICSVADDCRHEVLEDGNFWRLIFHICNGEGAGDRSGDKNGR